ncbi:hypothetical protein [Streptomyces sp. NPDC007856]|uniref:hypothetical protein n=1 Tax=Streptomyces sp. NPDC007856 TaxID=3364781 RepID=UPI0036AAE905
MPKGQDGQPGRGRQPRPSARIQQSPAKAGLLAVLGWALVGMGSLAGGAAYSSLRNGEAQHGWLVVGVELFIMAVGLGAGRRAIRRGNRHRAPVLASLNTLPDGEHIVLFLRSFADDDGFAHIPTGHHRGPWAATVDTEEQQLARATAPFGRMVALGRPDDRLPQAGATRRYASDHDWQAQVLAALDRASLVLLACGPGRSLRWEVQQVVARDRPERLVLIISRSLEQYASFRAATQDLFPKPLPDSADQTSRVAHRMQGPDAYTREAIWFDSDWTPHRAPLGSMDDPEVKVHQLIRYHRWVETAFPLAIRPVFRRAGVPIPGLPDAQLARPWAAKTGVALLALAATAAVVGFAMSGNVEALTTGMIFLFLPVALLLYGTWRGVYVALQFLTIITGILATVILLLIVLLGQLFHGLPSGRLAVALLLAADLIAALLLLHRRDVRDWVASRALKTPEGSA